MNLDIFCQVGFLSTENIIVTLAIRDSDLTIRKQCRPVLRSYDVTHSIKGQIYQVVDLAIPMAPTDMSA